jgi:DNA modification methylase
VKLYAHSSSLIYVCMDWRHIAELLAAANANGLEIVNLCVWTKPNGGMGSFYRSQHELVFIFKLGCGTHCNNIQLGRYGRNRTNVWAYANGPGFGRAGEEGHLAALHPTVKPVAMVADAILDSSRRGDIVFDPFLGSGTTVMAAERVGRRCYGLELDPLYVDVILRRWQAFTGAIARHAASGLGFDEIARTRDAACPNGGGEER